MQRFHFARTDRNYIKSLIELGQVSRLNVDKELAKASGGKTKLASLDEIALDQRLGLQVPQVGMDRFDKVHILDARYQVNPDVIVVHAGQGTLKPCHDRPTTSCQISEIF